MKKIIILTASAIILLISFNSCQRGPQTATAGVIINPVENMYSRADDQADVVSQALLGTSVKILKSEKDAKRQVWYQIETPDTYQGWVSGQALRLYGPEEKAYASEGQVIEITSLFAYLYSGPDVTKQKPLLFAPISSVLVLEKFEGRWGEVILPDNRKAFIQMGDGQVKQAPFQRPRLSPEQMVELAKRFLGLPYFWGGTSPLGLDCSGYVQLIYRLSGLEILRDADIQFTKSGLLEVPKGQEKTGDLVFFGRKSIGHVGMMISEREFIHATTNQKPMVQISNLYDDYWQSIYQGARRPKD
ncbi:MAG: SH3 domain-containing C40 family peptidase [Candidatus Saccharicenans sp.]|nr:C40 family peptidase [Candidatus Saccharicenans sp.]MDH7576140.1 SH3 domain-containing C40 family peptidase [Candidatus Saccharicenans sp.]